MAKASQSIHPRSARKNGEKVNTTATADPATKARKLAGLQRHFAEHPRCAHTASRIAALSA